MAAHTGKLVEIFVFLYFLLIKDLNGDFVRKSSDCGFTRIQIIPENGEGVHTIGIKDKTATSCSQVTAPVSKPSHLGFRLVSDGVWHPTFPDILRKIKIKEIVSRCDYSYQPEPCGICDEVNHNSSVFRTIQRSSHNTHVLKKCADSIMESKLFPVPSGFDSVNNTLVFGVVLINMGLYNDAIEHFTNVIQNEEDQVLAYMYRAVALMKRSIQNNDKQSLIIALEDVLRAEEKYTDLEVHIRKAEILSLLHDHGEARESLNVGLEHTSTVAGVEFYLRRGRENLVLEKYADAEHDFRVALQQNGSHVGLIYYLALTLHKRGKIRNAIEVYKEGLEMQVNPYATQMETSLSEAYLQLGLSNSTLTHIDHVLTLTPNTSLPWRVKADAYYHTGRTSLASQHYHTCVNVCNKYAEDESSTCQYCRYMKAVSHITQGQFYKGLKATAEVVVKQQYTTMKMTPEYVKAHYLKECGRFPW